MLDNISYYYEGFFYGTFKITEKGKIIYHSKYFRLEMSLFIFANKVHLKVSIYGVNPISNDFFLRT